MHDECRRQMSLAKTMKDQFNNEFEYLWKDADEKQEQKPVGELQRIQAKRNLTLQIMKIIRYILIVAVVLSVLLIPVWGSMNAPQSMAILVLILLSLVGIIVLTYTIGRGNDRAAKRAMAEAERKAKLYRQPNAPEYAPEAQLHSQKEGTDEGANVLPTAQATEVAARDPDHMPQLCEEIAAYAVQNRTVIKPEVLRELLAGMATSHLIFFRGADHATVQGIASLLNGLFRPGVSAVPVMPAQEGEALLSYCRGINAKKQMCVRELNAPDWETFSQKYGAFLRMLPTVYTYVDDIKATPYEQAYARWEQLFFFCALGDALRAEDMPTEWTAAAVIIEVASSDVIISATQDASQMPSDAGTFAGVIWDHNLFAELVVTAKDVKGLSLATWKKLDKLQATLATYGGKALDNIAQRQLERFVAVQMSMGMEETEAFDRAFMAKLIPLYRNAFAAMTVAHISPAETLESIFGAQALPLSRRALATAQAR